MNYEYNPFASDDKDRVYIQQDQDKVYGTVVGRYDADRVIVKFDHWQQNTVVSVSSLYAPAQEGAG